MKILFLDIDGVLNSHRFLYDEGGFARQKALDERGGHAWERAMLDPGAITRLRRVIDATGARIVISSSWRIAHPQEELRAILEPYGIDFVGYTPQHRSDNATRGKEIARWLRESSGVTDYAVVDDSLDAGDGHGDRFVRTTWTNGLLDEHVDELIRILGRCA